MMYNIWKNVFAYQSYDNKIFYKYFLPGIFQLALIPKIIFLSGMLFSGIFFRKRTPFFQFLAYTALLLILTTATTNQYLVIPQIFASIFYYPFGFLYTVAGISFFLAPLKTYNHFMYMASPVLLIMIFIWIYRKKTAGILRKIAEELEK